mmetsp:Transcript_16187/g.50072  ORF Transcript_16187/g.50072 Transcript_16187/m.50072 type:complete len:206 (+) Transcript_16187:601-1218(+)
MPWGTFSPGRHHRNPVSPERWIRRQGSSSMREPRRRARGRRLASHGSPPRSRSRISNGLSQIDGSMRGCRLFAAARATLQPCIKRSRFFACVCVSRDVTAVGGSVAVPRVLQRWGAAAAATARLITNTWPQPGHFLVALPQDEPQSGHDFIPFVTFADETFARRSGSAGARARALGLRVEHRALRLVLWFPRVRAAIDGAAGRKR